MSLQFTLFFFFFLPRLCKAPNYKLSCEEIPGSLILDLKLEKRKKNELKFWLDCRDLKYKSGNTRAELFFGELNLDQIYLFLNFFVAIKRFNQPRFRQQLSNLYSRSLLRLEYKHENL